jgi:hypothetical protein
MSADRQLLAKLEELRRRLNLGYSARTMRHWSERGYRADGKETRASHTKLDEVEATVREFDCGQLLPNRIGIRTADDAATWLMALDANLDRAIQELAKKGKRAPAKPSEPDAPADPFTRFIGKQRPLLLALWNKGDVHITVVLKELYGSASSKNRDALDGVVKRTNRKLATEVLRYEIKRKGDYLSLRQV